MSRQWSDPDDSWWRRVAEPVAVLFAAAWFVTVRRWFR